MARKAKELRDLVIDEISLVDKGANQHATVTIAKRHGEEENTMEEYFDQDGNMVDITSLAEGDVVFDSDGDAYQFSADVDEAVQEELELEPVGKSSVFARQQPAVAAGLADRVRVELSKALTEADRDEVIAKALGAIDEIAKSAEIAREAAAAERDLRITREYVEVAKGYALPVSPEELGPVLKRLGETLTVPEQKIIAKCLDAASSAIFQEIGKRGGGDNSDVLTQVDELVNSQVSKGASSREEAYTSVFESNPQAYDEYLAERQGR
jgi:hypothetical protein